MDLRHRMICIEWEQFCRERAFTEPSPLLLLLSTAYSLPLHSPVTSHITNSPSVWRQSRAYPLGLRLCLFMQLEARELFLLLVLFWFLLFFFTQNGNRILCDQSRDAIPIDRSSSLACPSIRFDGAGDRQADGERDSHSFKCPFAGTCGRSCPSSLHPLH